MLVKWLNQRRVLRLEPSHKKVPLNKGGWAPNEVRMLAPMTTSAVSLQKKREGFASTTDTTSRGQKQIPP